MFPKKSNCEEPNKDINEVHVNKAPFWMGKLLWFLRGFPNIANPQKLWVGQVLLFRLGPLLILEKNVENDHFHKKNFN